MLHGSPKASNVPTGIKAYIIATQNQGKNRAIILGGYPKNSNLKGRLYQINLSRTNGMNPAFDNHSTTNSK